MGGSLSVPCAPRLWHASVSSDTDARQVAGGAHTVGGSEPVGSLFHEVTLGLATSRLTGYQLAFFTIQGPAALASGRLERLARRGGTVGKIIAQGSTVLFMAVTSVLFFDGVGKIFPFIYASRSPLP